MSFLKRAFPILLSLLFYIISPILAWHYHPDFPYGPWLPQATVLGIIVILFHTVMLLLCRKNKAFLIWQIIINSIICLSAIVALCSAGGLSTVIWIALWGLPVTAPPYKMLENVISLQTYRWLMPVIYLIPLILTFAASLYLRKLTKEEG